MASGATIELRGARTPQYVWPVLAAAVVAVSLAINAIRFALDQQVPALFVAAARLSIAALVVTPVILDRHRAQHYLLKARDQLLIFLTGPALPMQLAGSGSFLIGILLATSGQPEQR